MNSPIDPPTPDITSVSSPLWPAINLPARVETPIASLSEETLAECKRVQERIAMDQLFAELEQHRLSEQDVDELAVRYTGDRSYEIADGQPSDLEQTNEK